MRRRALVLAAAWLLPFGPSVAQENRAAAQAKVVESTNLFRAGDYEGALASLRGAEKIVAAVNDPSLPLIRFNIARCLELLERWPEALIAYEAYNKLPDAQHRKQRAWKALTALEARVFGTLGVQCSPRGATVRVEGVADGPQPCPWRSDRVKPGRYVVQVTSADYRPWEQTVTVDVGRPVSLRVALEPDPLAAPAALASRPPSALQAKAVEANWAPPRYWTWIAAGAGAVALVGGGALTATAVSDRDEIEGMVPGDDRSTRIDDFESRRTLSYAAYGVGAAALMAGLTFFMLSDEPGAAESASSSSEIPLAFGVQW